MEIKTTLTTCPNGHHYDAAQHLTCPYCVGNFRPTEAPGGSFSSPEPSGGMFSPTEAPGGAGPAMFTPTEPPAGPSIGYNPGFVATAPPENNSWSSGNINPFSVETVIGGDVTPSPSGGKVQAEPVVGWLVCIEGPVRGMDFRIHAGYNYIGRESGDIHLSGDPQISRQNHAMVAFDGSDMTYFVGPAAGRNLIKVNGKTVLNAVEIKSYDVISIGTTKLLFVALCGDQFSWGPTEADNG